ncbi:unnamed protein product [Clonostachys chloroleuca]|uniref:Uncharacterized protein n=1 Tax=Clonostachys chloroleuca TaxID=1926264 RepID=A0AA35Q1N9_9HYPO|nr:unnamed protein product [Clonostachys chloroleuca]
MMLRLSFFLTVPGLALTIQASATGLN